MKRGYALKVCGIVALCGTFMGLIAITVFVNLESRADAGQQNVHAFYSAVSSSQSDSPITHRRSKIELIDLAISGIPKGSINGQTSPPITNTGAAGSVGSAYVHNSRPDTIIDITTDKISVYHFNDPALDALISRRCPQDGYPVPNIVHYVWLGNRPMQFHHFISVLSSHKHIKPCIVMFHSDVLPTGYFWDLLIDDVSELVHVRANQTSYIFGKPIFLPEHRSDVVRLEVLIRYGGIYLDTDTVVIQDFTPLRHNGLTMDRTDHISINSAAILAAPGSAFLKMWHLAYNTFTEKEWGSHSVIMAHRLQSIYPRLITVLNGNLTFLGGGLELQKVDYHWPRTAYAMHLFARLMTKKDYTMHDVMTGRNTFAALCRYTLFGSREPIDYMPSTLRTVGNSNFLKIN